MQNGRNAVGARFMLVATLGFSVVPVLVALGGSESPFWFFVGWRISALSVCAAIPLIFWRAALFSAATRSLVWRSLFTPPMLLWILNYFDTSLFALSVRFANVAVNAVLYETWPIVFVLLVGRLFKSESRWQKITVRRFALFLASFVGAVLVITSQPVGEDNDCSVLSVAVGVSLALAAASLTCLNAFGFRWTADFVALLSARIEERRSLEMFSTVLGLAVINAVSLPANAAIAIASGEVLALTPIMLGAMGGLLVGAASVIFWRWGNLISDRLELNAVIYLTPALSLIWLFALGLVGEIRVGLLLAGVLAIVAANAGVYFDSRVKQR